MGAYYGLLGTCLLFTGLVFSVQRAHRRFGPNVALAAAMLAIVVTPTWPVLDRVGAADLHAAQFIHSIPADDIVCAQSPLAPHRAPSQGLQMIPNCDAAQWVLFGREHDHWPIEDPSEFELYLTHHTNDGAHAVAFSEGDYVFLRRAQRQVPAP